MDDNFKTSQTDFSLPEGPDPVAVPAVQYGEEPSGAPAPVTQPMKGESIKMEATQTSQQKSGDHSVPESGN